MPPHVFNQGILAVLKPEDAPPTHTQIQKCLSGIDQRGSYIAHPCNLPAAIICPCLGISKWSSLVEHTRSVSYPAATANRSGDGV